MLIFELFAIAVGLAMDAFAVSIAAGIQLGCVTGRQTFRMAFHFGLFQFFMPVIGWYAGNAAQRFISGFDHWVALGLLGFIGGKMVHGALGREDSEAEASCDPTKGMRLAGLSVATSIDALAVGLSLGVLRMGIWLPSVLIGVVAAAFTTLGIKLGCRFGLLFGKRMELIGGLILIGIGVKIVLDHTVFGG